MNINKDLSKAYLEIDKLNKSIRDIKNSQKRSRVYNLPKEENKGDMAPNLWFGHNEERTRNLLNNNTHLVNKPSHENMSHIQSRINHMKEKELRGDNDLESQRKETQIKGKAKGVFY